MENGKYFYKILFKYKENSIIIIIIQLIKVNIIIILIFIFLMNLCNFFIHQLKQLVNF